jgi:hypothetical protein
MYREAEMQKVKGKLLVLKALLAGGKNLVSI